MPGYGFSLSRIFPDKDRIDILFLYGKIQIRKNAYSGIFNAVREISIVLYNS